MGHKKLVHSIVAGAIIASTSSVAMATLTWDTCGITRVGALGASTIAVKIESCKNGNDGKWLNIANQQNPSLAVLLTGLSLGNKVKIEAHYNLANTSSVGAGADIETIYLDQ